MNRYSEIALSGERTDIVSLQYVATLLNVIIDIDESARHVTILNVTGDDVVQEIAYTSAIRLLCERFRWKLSIRTIAPDGNVFITGML